MRRSPSSGAKVLANVLLLLTILAGGGASFLRADPRSQAVIEFTNATSVPVRVTYNFGSTVREQGIVVVPPSGSWSFGPFRLVESFNYTWTIVNANTLAAMYSGFSTGATMMGEASSGWSTFGPLAEFRYSLHQNTSVGAPWVLTGDVQMKPAPLGSLLLFVPLFVGFFIAWILLSPLET